MINKTTTTMKPWDREVPDQSAGIIQTWGRELREAEKRGFDPLTDFASLSDGQRVRADSEDWVSRFLTDAASPYQTDVDVRRSVHHAPAGDLPDVLRHEFSILFRESVNTPPVTIDLTITETVTWLRADVRRDGFDILRLPEVQRAPAIAWFAERVMRLQGTHLGKNFADEPHHWTFLHGPLVEGARFSTAPGISEFSMWSWADRVDGGIEDGHVFFFGFKHREATDGKMIFPDSKHWFDGKCWDVPRGRR